MNVNTTLSKALTPQRLGIRARFTLLFYLVTLLAMGAVGYYGYKSSVDVHLRMAEAQVKDHAVQVSSKIVDFLELSRSDLNYFATSGDLIRKLYWIDVGDERKFEQWHAITLDAWRGFMRNYDYLYRVRFLDLQGRELINIRRDPRSRQIRALNDDELGEQDISPHLLKARQLDKGQIAAAPLDLNREQGKVARPLVPVVRLSQPVFGENQVRYGVLAIDLFADAFFDHIREANKRIDGGVLYLLDGNGEFLFHPDGSKSFAHLLGHGDSFRARFPGILAQLKILGSGILIDQGQVFGFRKIFPLPGDREHYWILVGAVDASEVLEELTQFKYVFFSILFGVLLLVLLVSRYYLNNLLRPLLSVTRQVERLGRGEIRREAVIYKADDEIGRMLESSDRLTANMEALASQADSIAAGDFSRSVPVLSEQDRLAAAINNMTRMLRDNREETEQRNWLQDGIGQLNQALTGELDPAELADLAVGFLSRYLEAGHGVFYLFDEQQQTLELLGSYMYTERDHLNQHLQLGQGAIGQVARERKPILLRNIRPEEREIDTGSVSTTPANTYTVPLLYEKQLYGVLELATLQPIDHQQQAFVDQAAEVIGAFLYSVLQRRQIRELLASSEAATQEAESRSLQLQEANARMEEQQQQLQQQTEELQQTNAQMEEQQQQLQQQTEELQQTNAQMEEQQQQLEQQAGNMEQQNRELLASQQELDRRAGELEQASRYKSEFLANMSHELRTPLNSIILLSRMLSVNEENNLSPEEQKRAEVVHHAGEELLRLINDILDLSKIEAGRMELQLQPLHSASLATEYSELFHEIARDKGLEFHVEDRLDKSFTTDHDKLSQIVRNLLSNAFKFTHQGSVSLKLETGEDPSLPIRISVTDTGIGIPEDKRQLIFEAFQQVDGSVSREYGGTGLGLSISLRFASLLGGHIDLQSEPDRGSTFSILLPESPPVTKPANQPEVSKYPSEKRSSFTRQAPIADDRHQLQASDQVILLIDDDRSFGESVAAINRRLGYKTLIAPSAEEGLRMARKYRPHGILLDLGLPDQDGSEVLRELKATRELRAIPIYIVSARDRDESLLQPGILGYLQKPVDENSLAEAEAKVLSGSPGGGGRLLVLESGSLNSEELGRMTGQGVRAVVPAGTLEQAAQLLGSDSFDMAIIDLGRDGIEKGLQACRTLREQAPELGILFYGEQPLSSEDETRLREFSDSIILKAPQANQRMSENIERFLRQMPASSPRNPRQRSDNSAVTGGLLENRQILVVDDDPRNLFVVTSALEQQGARVTSALNGRKALEALQKQAADLVIMDIMMPEMDGYETIRNMKEDPTLRHIPIVALTAKAMKDDREKAMKAGADDYLSKPVDYEMLVNTVALWCREQA